MNQDLQNFHDVIDRILILDDIHEEKAILYDMQTNTILKAPNELAHVIKELKVCKDLHTIEKNFSIDSKNLIAFLEKLAQIINNKKTLQCSNAVKRNKISSLRIIVSNDCNLRCKYCYASGGGYNLDRNLMEEDTARKIIKQLCIEFDSVDEVNFFGGEPLMNIKTIKTICQCFEDSFSNGLISKVPRFSLTTNGTILTDEIINTIKSYNISVLVSLDGPKYINDKLRIYINGKGTYDIIANNIKKLKEKTGQPLAIECTYTMQHYINNYKYVDLLRYFKNEFDIDFVFIIPVDLTEEQKLHIKDIGFSNELIKEIQEKEADTLFESFIDEGLIEFSLIKFISKLNKKTYSNYFCMAGLTQLTINVNGDIYPCQLFVNNNSENKLFYMGNVLEDKVIKNPHYLKVYDKLLSNSKENNTKCKKCNEKYFCSACIATTYNKENTISPISHKFCRSIFDSRKTYIKNIGRIYLDKDKWALFHNKLDEMKSKIKTVGLDIGSEI